jgi:catechol 2,3-dioxygenase-like lactoylglutathione lyase family enzyme
MAFLSCRVNHHDINLVFFPPETTPSPSEYSRNTRGAGLHHFALLVENKKEFEAWFHHIQACGIQIEHGPVVHSYTHPEGNNTPGENRSFYFADPSGNLIEICCDMGQMTEDNQLDPHWHAERLRRDGYH